MKAKDENNLLALHQYGIALMKKIKHEIYDLLERMVQENEYQESLDDISEQDNELIKNPQLNQYRFKPFKSIDPLTILQSQIFDNYQQNMTEFIQNLGISQEESIQSLNFQMQVSQSQIDRQIRELSNQEQGFTSPTKQYQCSCNNNGFQLNNCNKSQSGQRELELLIREKQINKKLTQVIEELQETKSLLEQKQSELSKLRKQLNSLKKLTEKQNLNKLRQQKVRSLKDKIEMESIKREFCLQRERDNLQLMIQKENIHSNHQQQYLYHQTGTNGLASSTKINHKKSLFMKKKDFSPRKEEGNQSFSYHEPHRVRSDSFYFQC